MRTLLTAVAPLGCLALVAAPAPLAAAPGGPIGVLPLGHYVCELPGDATGAAGLRQTEPEFTITFGSTYRAATGVGTYLLTGDRLAFTSGPMMGRTYRRTGGTFLRQILPDGRDGRLRCVRQGGTKR